MGEGEVSVGRTQRAGIAPSAALLVLAVCLHCDDPATESVALPSLPDAAVLPDAARLPDRGSPVDAGPFGFRRDVHPIFVTSCGPCHVVNGPYHDIASPDLALAFGDAVEYADRIIARIRQGNMPPGCVFDEAECVSDESLLVIERWVEAGFPP